MVNALLVFLIGVLVLIVLVLVLKLLIDWITATFEMPAQVRHIILLVMGLILLIMLILLAVHAYNGGIVLVPVAPVRAL